VCVGYKQVLAYVNNVRGVEAKVDHDAFTLEDVESNDVRCPDQEAAAAMYKGGHLCASASECATQSTTVQLCAPCTSFTRSCVPLNLDKSRVAGSQVRCLNVVLWGLCTGAGHKQASRA
jgi:hypothetical protein